MKVAVCPAAIVAAVEPFGAAPTTAAGLDVPVRVMDCGELGASSVIKMVAERVPVASGAKERVSAQFALTA